MFLTPAGNGYTPKLLLNEQVAFSPVFLEFMQKINTIRQAFFPAGAPEINLTFDLTPNSTPGVSESLLEVDGQLLRYRNEPPLPNPMTWPSKSAAPQAKLSAALGGSGERPGIKTIEGEWAFFRLLSQAHIVPQTQTTCMVNWSLPSSSGSRVDVRYKLQSRSFLNPFAPDLFKNVVCPERVSRQQGAGAN